MACGKPVPKSSQLSMEERRLLICGGCPENIEGICQPIKQKHPGRDVIENGIKRPELSCPRGKWPAEKHPCQSCGRMTIEAVNCRPCQNKKRIDSNYRARKANHSFSSAFRSQGKPQWVSVSQMQVDAMKLASKVPLETDTIVGVARSGLAVATIVSMVTHLPLVAVRQNRHDLIEVGNGWRLGGKKHIQRGTRAFVVDDTVMTGNSLRAISGIAERHFESVVYGAVYVNPLASKKPDTFVRELGWPHLLEWNVFNSVLSPNMALDFDGIICHDPTEHFTDDAAHIDWISQATSKYLPRKSVVPLIVTARIEKYRKATEDWLRRHKVKFSQLVMHPAKSLAERDASNIASYKAKHFKAWALRHKPAPPPLMFIESDPRQAKQIHDLSGGMVVCPSSSQVFS